MKQAQKEATQTRRKLCLASLIVGLALAGIAGTAMVIDLRNNQAFGAKFSPELGMVMALAAVALTALPAAAALLGRWEWRLKYGTAFAVLLTVLSAVSAYSEKQGAEILARQGAGDAYREAQANAAAARKELAEAHAEAAAISETASVSDLQAIVARHRELAQIEAKDRGGRGNKAKAHEDAEQDALARVPAARAKAAATARATAAQVRLDAAQQDTKAGPTEVSMLATVVAGRTGQAPEDIARAIALGTTVASILVTLILALLAEQATALIMRGFGVSGIAGEVKELAAKEAVLALVPVPAKPRVISIVDRVADFAEATFKTGCRISGSELYILFEEWWLNHYLGERMPTPAALSKLLVEKGIQRKKLSGRMQYWLEEDAKAAA